MHFHYVEAIRLCIYYVETIMLCIHYIYHFTPPKIQKAGKSLRFFVVVTMPKVTELVCHVHSLRITGNTKGCNKWIKRHSLSTALDC